MWYSVSTALTLESWKVLSMMFPTEIEQAAKPARTYLGSPARWCGGRCGALSQPSKARPIAIAIPMGRRAPFTFPSTTSALVSDHPPSRRQLPYLSLDPVFPSAATVLRPLYRNLIQLLKDGGSRQNTSLLRISTLLVSLFLLCSRLSRPRRPGNPDQQPAQDNMSGSSEDPWHLPANTPSKEARTTARFSISPGTSGVTESQNMRPPYYQATGGLDSAAPRPVLDAMDR
ncbi:hypothetical protein CMUS01_00582 [Colletotrichum musicola]|uniref:Uncharacterized protein n=1 Tax=Colletotrichum musicola TaxID=2175873 RepID=A0A8H6U988_9PEZI|nr:hypothetical protein CMUS01_00582 [Colletotrichum musicola]